MDSQIEIFILVIAIFMLFAILGIITYAIELIKSFKYNTVSAIIVDSVISNSEQYGEYFPDEYERNLRIKDKFKTILKNNSKDNIEEQKFEMIAEYEVDGKKYYYSELKTTGIFDLKNQYCIGKIIELKYNPNNPSKVIRNFHRIKGIIFFIFLILFLLLMLYVILKSK